jgi:hypothetical protein
MPTHRIERKFDPVTIDRTLFEAHSDEDNPQRNDPPNEQKTGTQYCDPP